MACHQLLVAVAKVFPSPPPQYCFLAILDISQRNAHDLQPYIQWLRLHVVLHDGLISRHRCDLFNSHSRSQRRTRRLLCQSVRFRCSKSYSSGIESEEALDRNRHPAKTPRYGKRQRDVAFVDFNMTAGPFLHPSYACILLNYIFVIDLTPLFHWNTKQVFLYVQADYKDAQGVRVTSTPHVLMLQVLTVIILPGQERSCYLGQNHSPQRGRFRQATRKERIYLQKHRNFVLVSGHSTFSSYGSDSQSQWCRTGYLRSEIQCHAIRWCINLRRGSTD